MVVPFWLVVVEIAGEFEDAAEAVECLTADRVLLVMVIKEVPEMVVFKVSVALLLV